MDRYVFTKTKKSSGNLVQKRVILQEEQCGLDEDRDRLLGNGAVNIRHYLNDSLLKEGGHIGDGIRPSERRKGYATEMIRLALTECKKLGIEKVLMTCDKDNIGSARSIIKNGGILENEFVNSEGNIEQRYWISL